TLLSISSFYLYFLLLPGADRVNLSLPDIIVEPDRILQITRAYLFATAGYLHFELLAITAGLLINVYFALITWQGYYKKNGSIYFTFLYLLHSLFVISLFRYQPGTDQLISSRYQVFTLTINALLAISLIESGMASYLPVRHLKKILVTAFAALYLSSFYYVGNLASERERIREGLTAWRSSAGNSLHHPQPLRASRILSMAIDTGIYSLPNPGR
ncbi:MAG: hypothetical protein RL120_08555, partial [Gammaproteobacteria bacterium]